MNARRRSSAPALVAVADIEDLSHEGRGVAPADRALVLLYLDGISYAEMAEVIGISESNVGVRLNRVKKLLAEALKESTDVA